jgi:hypothetical protein
VWREGGRSWGRQAATHAPDPEPDKACHRSGEPAGRGCKGHPGPEPRSRLTCDKSPVRENRTPGSVRGLSGNWQSCRDQLFLEANGRNAQFLPTGARRAYLGKSIRPCVPELFQTISSCDISRLFLASFINLNRGDSACPITKTLVVVQLRRRSASSYVPSELWNRLLVASILISS